METLQHVHKDQLYRRLGLKWKGSELRAKLLSSLLFELVLTNSGQPSQSEKTSLLECGQNHCTKPACSI